MMPKDKILRSGVFLFIFNRDFSKLLMIKRNDEKRKKYGFDWGVVGGKVEQGEGIIEAGMREAKEEIGIDLRQEQLKFLHYEHHERYNKEYPEYKHLGFFYSVVLDESVKIRINDESDEFRWFPINELPSSIIDGERIGGILEQAKARQT
jgi:8-oxo-dGTP pyrophosphatase MutT (NUDIX family)